MAPVSLKQLAEDLRSGRLSLLEYLELAMIKIDCVEPLIQSFVPEENRKIRLLMEAKSLLERYPVPEERPLLFGVLIGIKDIIRTEHLPTLAGSQLPPSVFSGKEADIVTKLKEAGALILGKTACTEFAYFQPCKTRNPLNTAHTPGGSSSGSAAAVASGIIPLTVGTQTIASVIRPASYCGISGYKPSYGRVSLCGIFPFAQSADQVGFFTAGVEDMILTAQAVIDDWNQVQQGQNPIIGIPSEVYLRQALPKTLESFYKTVRQLADAGLEIRERPLFSDIELINRMHKDLIAYEFARNHEALISQYGDLYSEHSTSLYRQGEETAVKAVEEARKKQLELRFGITELMEREQIDLWITPAATSTAPKGLRSTGSPLMSLPWTFCGLPSLTIPSDRDNKGLPFGLQIVAAYADDENLLSYAKAIESVIRV